MLVEQGVGCCVGVKTVLSWCAAQLASGNMFSYSSPGFIFLLASQRRGNDAGRGIANPSVPAQPPDSKAVNRYT